MSKNFKLSRKIFSDPSQVLSLLTGRPASIESWDDIRLSFHAASEGSAWDRLQSDLDFNFFVGNPIIYSGCIPEDLHERAILILAELSVDYSQGLNFDRFSRITGIKDSSENLVEKALSFSRKKFSEFPLLEFCMNVLNGSGDVYELTLDEVARIRPLIVRQALRTRIQLMSMEAEISWPEWKLRLCERFDLLTMQVSGTNSEFISREIPTEIQSKILPNLSSDRASDLTKKIPSAPAGVDTEQLRQRTLMLNAHRMLSRQLGRGALLLGSNRLMDDTPINLSGKFGNVGIVSMDTNLLPIEALFWPEFQNGFSQALSQPLSAGIRSLITVHKTRTDLILQSKKRIYGVPPEQVPLALHRHAGFVFGLLIRASESVLRPDDLFKYLKIQNEVLSVGVILGSAISRRKTACEETGKMCLVHIPGQLPTHDVEVVDISPGVQSAALAGLGFVYSQTCNRQVLEVLLTELGRKPVGDKPVTERESLAFSSGFAIGLVALGKGSKLPSDLRLAERLLELIEGQTEKKISAAPPVMENSARVSLLFEAIPGANRAVTLPAACLGLGLAYLGSNDISVADLIRVPPTAEEMENTQVRPDSLLFKYLAKSLIMLDVIEPSMEFILSQLPKYVADPVSVLEYRELRAAGSEAPSCVDWLALFQTRMYAISGIALALGLKFAGTNDGETKILLTLIFKEFLEVQWTQAHCAAMNASRPASSMGADRVTIETCRACVLLALTVVASGSGDPQVLKLIKQMRERIDEYSSFGIGQAADMALGFLYLGLGRQTFKNDFFSIACLLGSIVPRYPVSVSGNKSNLQVLRNLFLLAAEDRTVDVVDVGTLENVNSVEVEILDDHDTVISKMVLPGKLPPGANKIRIANSNEGRYFPMEIEVSRGRTLYVQRKLGTLPESQDPKNALGSAAAYISEFSEPCETEIRKLLGLPLGQVEVREGKRKDWRLGIAGLGAVAVPGEDVEKRLQELRENTELVNGIPLKITEKYAHLLVGGKSGRAETLVKLQRAIEKGSLATFLDDMENNSYM